MCILVKVLVSSPWRLWTQSKSVKQYWMQFYTTWDQVGDLSWKVYFNASHFRVFRTCFPVSNTGVYSSSLQRFPATILRVDHNWILFLGLVFYQPPPLTALQLPNQLLGSPQTYSVFDMNTWAIQGPFPSAACSLSHSQLCTITSPHHTQ